MYLPLTPRGSDSFSATETIFNFRSDYGNRRGAQRLQAAHTYHDSKLDFMKNDDYGLRMNDPVKDSANRYVIGLGISPYLSTLTLALSVWFYALGKGTFKRHGCLPAKSGHVPFVGTPGSKRVAHPVGFPAASGRTYPTKVKLLIPETVGHNFVVPALSAKLRLSVWYSARQHELAGQ